MVGVIFFLTVIALATGQSTEVEQCSPEFGDLPLNAYVQGCTTMPCRLPQREDAVIDVVFEAPHTIRSMKSIARVTFLGMTFNYSLGENEVTCNHIQNTYCPLLKGEVVKTTIRMHIEPIFPTVSASVDFLVEDTAQNPIWCLRLRIQVVAPRTNRISQNSNHPILNKLISNSQHLESM